MKTTHDPSAKPYYKCLSCQRFRHDCAGLPTRDMTLQEWCEMIRDVMDYCHIHNSTVSKEAEVSEKTVEKIRAGTMSSDIMRSTERGIERVVLGPVGNHQCYQEGADTERIKQLQAAVEHLLQENQRYAKIIDKYIE